MKSKVKRSAEFIEKKIEKAYDIDCSREDEEEKDHLLKSQEQIIKR